MKRILVRLTMIDCDIDQQREHRRSHRAKTGTDYDHRGRRRRRHRWVRDAVTKFREHEKCIYICCGLFAGLR